jgi:Arc/MetJ-type ribon-helix-helix transcriptional regulator
MPKKRKAPYDTTLRFRAFKALEKRIDRIVEARGYGDPADFMREGLSNLVLKEEERLGLPPLPSPTQHKVSYSVKLARKKKRQAARQKKSAA